MKPKLIHRLTLGILVALLLTSPLLLGCVQVQVTGEKRDEATPTPYGVLSSPREEHDLAILGIEFSPPLKYEEIAAAGKLALLAAVENRGSSVESNVVLEARLTGITDTDRILSRSENLPSIAPGEVGLLHFENLFLIPYRPSYVLTVIVLPVPGEVHVADNQRTYRFQIVFPTPTP